MRRRTVFTLAASALIILLGVSLHRNNVVAAVLRHDSSRRDLETQFLNVPRNNSNDGVIAHSFAKDHKKITVKEDSSITPPLVSADSVRVKQASDEASSSFGASEEDDDEEDDDEEEVVAHARLLATAPQAKWVTAQGFNLHDLSHALLAATKAAANFDLLQSSPTSPPPPSSSGLHSQKLRADTKAAAAQMSSDGKLKDGGRVVAVSMVVLNGAQGCLFDNFVAHLLKSTRATAAAAAASTTTTTTTTTVQSGNKNESSANSKGDENDDEYDDDEVASSQSLVFPPLVVFALDRHAFKACRRIVSEIKDTGYSLTSHHARLPHNQAFRSGVWITCVGPHRRQVVSDATDATDSSSTSNLTSTSSEHTTSSDRRSDGRNKHRRNSGRNGSEDEDDLSGNDDEEEEIGGGGGVVAVEYGDLGYRTAVWMKPMLLGLALLVVKPPPPPPPPPPPAEATTVASNDVDDAGAVLIVIDVDVVLLRPLPPLHRLLRLSPPPPQPSPPPSSPSTSSSSSSSSVTTASTASTASTATIGLACEVGSDLATVNTGFMVVQATAEARAAVNTWTSIASFPPLIDDQAAFRQRVVSRRTTTTTTTTTNAQTPPHALSADEAVQWSVQCFPPNVINLACSCGESSSSSSSSKNIKGVRLCSAASTPAVAVHCTEVPDKVASLAELSLWDPLLERRRRRRRRSRPSDQTTTKSRFVHSSGGGVGGHENDERKGPGEQGDGEGQATWQQHEQEHDGKQQGASCRYGVPESWWKRHPRQREARDSKRAAAAIATSAATAAAAARH